MGNTKVGLVKDLENALALAKGISSDAEKNLLILIDRAKKGYYHDFESPLATPKIELVADLRANGLSILAQKVIDGDYDE